MDQDDAAASDVLAPLDPDQIASRLRDERQLIVNGGIEDLHIRAEVEVPKTFRFNLADCEPWDVRRALGTYMGIREWDDIPTEIPPEHFDGFTAVLEAEARDRHSENRLWFKRRMGDYQAAYAQADYLREAVPAAVERLRPAYPDDLDKAHRPVRLALLGIEATACLDCAWLSEVDHVVTGERSPIGSHRGLHWDPPHANLCYFLHDGYETLAPQRFPDPWEVFEPLLYGPVATKARTFGQRKGKREFLFCDRCFERVGRDDFEPCKPGETPWTWDGDAGGFRWIENL